MTARSQMTLFVGSQKVIEKSNLNAELKCYILKSLNEGNKFMVIIF